MLLHTAFVIPENHRRRDALSKQLMGALLPIFGGMS